MKDDQLKNENWDRFLPKFKEIKQKKKKKKMIEKKEYDPFPPEQLPRKEDILMESGEYFLGEKERQQRVLERKKKKQEQKML
jgi:ribosomal RNA assembly protein